MGRSLIRLRRTLFGVSCAVVFGFGATHAFAMPDPELPLPDPWCIQMTGEPYYSRLCSERYCGFQVAYCGADELCHCGEIP